MKPTTHQIAILREAVSVIKAHRDQFNMRYYWGLKNAGMLDQPVFLENPQHNCGTVACFGGWIVAIDDARNSIKFKRNQSEVAARAEEILNFEEEYDLDGDPIDYTDKLFMPDSWPREFRVVNGDDWEKITPEQLEARVEHFIKTGE